MGALALLIIAVAIATTTPSVVGGIIFGSAIILLIGVSMGKGGGKPKS